MCCTGTIGASTGSIHARNKLLPRLRQRDRGYAACHRGRCAGPWLGAIRRRQRPISCSGAWCSRASRAAMMAGPAGAASGRSVGEMERPGASGGRHDHDLGVLVPIFLCCPTVECLPVCTCKGSTTFYVWKVCARALRGCSEMHGTSHAPWPPEVLNPAWGLRSSGGKPTSHTSPRVDFSPLAGRRREPPPHTASGDAGVELNTSAAALVRLT
jgi:hypothetical protein